MTMNFNGLVEVVKVQTRPKFHQAKCSGSWIIVLTRKQNQLKTILPSLPQAVIITLGLITWH